jgi:CelD/BcsL family acetyltransferase involved in cellulose biosynthesis
LSAAPVSDWLVPSEAGKYAAACRDLAARADPNPFADPDFLLPAFQFLAPRGLRFAAVWSDARRERLIAVAAIRPGLSPVSLARVWMHELAALPAILVDRENAGEAVAALKAAVKGRGAGLLIPAVERASALGRALMAASAEVVDQTQRAALSCGPAADFGAQLPAKRRKEWARQRRRLEDGGKLTFARGSGDALEAFLALEAAGWKGQRGTALSQNAASAGFVRAMIGNFAAREALEIATLRQGDALIAGGVVLKSGRRGFYWKTAFDESHAALSPGVQFTLQLSSALEKAPDLDLIDSCAIADHPMIDRLWPDRLELADFALPLGAEASFAFRAGRQSLEWSRTLKATAKRLLKR